MKIELNILNESNPPQVETTNDLNDSNDEWFEWFERRMIWMIRTMNPPAAETMNNLNDEWFEQFESAAGGNDSNAPKAEN